MWLKYNSDTSWVSSQGKFLIQDSLYKIESNFTQNKYNKLKKISAKNKWFFAKHKCKSENMGATFYFNKGNSVLASSIQISPNV